MALVRKIGTAKFTQDGEKYTLTDDTGDYDINTNPGGYGAPNEARVDFALMIIVYYKEYHAGDISNVKITPDTHDPTNVVTFSIPTVKDGHYFSTVYWVPIADYNSAVPTDDQLEASSYPKIESNSAILSKSNLERNKIITQRVENIVVNNSKKNIDNLIRKYDNIRVLQEGARIEFCKGEYVNFSRIVNALTTKVC